MINNRRTNTGTSEYICGQQRFPRLLQIINLLLTTQMMM